jgi:hypothetical protein
LKGVFNDPRDHNVQPNWPRKKGSIAEPELDAPQCQQIGLPPPAEQSQELNGFATELRNVDLRAL